MPPPAALSWHTDRNERCRGGSGAQGFYLGRTARARCADMNLSPGIRANSSASLAAGRAAGKWPLSLFMLEAAMRISSRSVCGAPNSARQPAPPPLHWLGRQGRRNGGNVSKAGWAEVKCTCGPAPPSLLMHSSFCNDRTTGKAAPPRI